MQILLATSNPHKLDEIEAVFNTCGDIGVQWVTLASLDQAIEEPIEDQPTFEGNAQLKACYYAKAAGMHCLADDSGLEVDALGGAPGVISARYAGVTGGREVADPANNQKLLAALQGIPPEKRTARFVCAMVLANAEGQVIASVRGKMDGRIIADGETQRGEHGFGYDPLFYLPDIGQTSAELVPEHKNAVSHRGAATRLMWMKLKAITGVAH